MSTIKETFGSAAQAIACTLASLANGAAREGTAVDNSSDLFLDALVFLNIKTGASGTLSDGYINIFAYGTVNGGTDYSDGATGTDAAITLTGPPNLRLIGVINTPANATTYKGGPFSVAASFGGALPQKWGVVIENQTGGAFDSTEGNFKKLYQGVFVTVS